jgi:hypothetical protein
MQRLYQYLDREDVPTKLPDALAAAVVFWSVMDESLDDSTQRWIGGIFGDCTLRFLDLMAEDEEASELELLLLEDFLGKQPHIDRIETTAVDYDVSSFDIVRLVCLVGEWLWSHPIVFHDNDPDDLVRLLGSLAWTHLIASRASSIKFMGELIPVSQPIRPIVWSLFNVVASLRPPQGTLSFLLATGLPQFVEPKGRQPIKITSLDHYDTEQFINEVEEEARWAGRRLELADLQERVEAIKSLVQDGIDYRHLEPDPRGQQYIVRLPDDHPARQPGYDQVRIFHYLDQELGETVLYAFEGNRGLMFTGAWFPKLDRIDGGLLIDGDLLLGIGDLTVAGIWRDLVVEAEAVLSPTSNGVREWGLLDKTGKARGLAVTIWVLQPLKEALASETATSAV